MHRRLCQPESAERWVVQLTPGRSAAAGDGPAGQPRSRRGILGVISGHAKNSCVCVVDNPPLQHHPHSPDIRSRVRLLSSESPISEVTAQRVAQRTLTLAFVVPVGAPDGPPTTPHPPSSFLVSLCFSRSGAWPRVGRKAAVVSVSWRDYVALPLWAVRVSEVHGPIRTGLMILPAIPVPRCVATTPEFQPLSGLPS